jgi:hypothetical protein
MSADAMTVGDALPQEMARVRDQVMPHYLAIGAPGRFALLMMRTDLDLAARAMVEGDVIGMVRQLAELRGYEA